MVHSLDNPLMHMPEKTKSTDLILLLPFRLSTAVMFGCINECYEPLPEHFRSNQRHTICADMKRLRSSL